MENEKQKYNFTVINGATVKVGHCSLSDMCNETVCVGTDCKKYNYKHKNLGK